MNLGLCLIGALVGTLVGVLPGIGPLATIAMLLPITFGLPPVGALIMLAGIYYGAMYGGSTTAILVNLPGESASVVTTLDGFQMAKQGRAGPALAIAALGSFFAGCVATIVVAVLGKPLTAVALKFGPAEYFSLMVLGLVFAVVLAKDSVPKAIAMILFGLLLSMVGTDIETGQTRMSFDIIELSDGIGFVAVAMGIFGFAEIMRNLWVSAGSRPRPAEDHRPDADQEGSCWRRRPPCCAARSWVRCSAFCPAAAPSWRRSAPTRWRRSSPRIRPASARARSKASRVRKAPTTPPRRPRSSRC